MPWVGRGLREGIVTSRYPRRPDGYGVGYQAAVVVVGEPALAPEASDALATLCPTGAIGTSQGTLRVDRGRCILCGRCVEARPDWFAFDSSPETARLSRRGLVVPAGAEEEARLAAARSALAARVRSLRRSVHLRHVDAGSDGSEEWEVAALTNPVYDIQRLGLYFTASPRHADLLLVTGVATAGMGPALQRTYEAMPHPKVVLAVGTDAVSGGLMHPSYATGGGIGNLLPVDVWIPGSPPSPFSLLCGILAGVGLLPRAHP
jgi:Ni,Fe-hydrogenase III small subunit/ferredoxin